MTEYMRKINKQKQISLRNSTIYSVELFFMCSVDVSEKCALIIQMRNEKDKYLLELVKFLNS